MRTTLRFNCGSIANQELFRFNKNLSALFVASITTIVIMWVFDKESSTSRKEGYGSVQTIGNRSTSIQKLFLHQSKKLICLSLISVAAFIFILMFLFYFNNFYYLRTFLPMDSSPAGSDLFDWNSFDIF